MTLDESTDIVTTLWVGLWPARERTELELSMLIEELQQDFYQPDEVREFLRHWALTQKFAPWSRDLVNFFRTKYRTSTRVKDKVTYLSMAVDNGHGTILDPVQAVCNLCVWWFNRGNKTIAARTKYFVTLVGVLTGELDMNYQAARNLAFDVFADVECRPNPEQKELPPGISDETRKRLEVAKMQRMLPPPKMEEPAKHQLPFSEEIP